MLRLNPSESQATMKLNIPAIAASDSPIMPRQDSDASSARLIIDDSATKRLRTVMSEKQNDHLKLRVRIRGGGCSGFQYRFELTETVNPDDHLWQQDGAVIIVDPLSQQMLNGARLEYFASPMESGFRLQNPHATSSCGCGVSFSV